MGNKAGNGSAEKCVVAVVNTNTSAARDAMRGVSAAAVRFGWRLETIDTAQTGFDLYPFRPLLERADGIVARGDGLAEIAAAETAPERPIVALDVYPGTMPSATAKDIWGRVLADHALIGQTAAMELLALNRNICVFVPMPKRYGWTKPRGRAFAEAVAAAGREVRIYRPATEWGWLEERDRLADWLASVPRPFGIFAGNDMLAKFAFDACRDAGLSVPSDAAIIGADDDENLCLSVTPSLSSIRIDFELGGRRAMEMLALFMEGPRLRRAATWRYGTLGVARRGSTNLLEPDADPRVAAGLDFISAHFANAYIGVRDVAAAMGSGRRQAERAFLATGKTIRGHIEERRLREVCALLRGTDATVKEIARRCGFASDIWLSILFRRRFGCAPGAWRAGVRTS